MDWVEKSQPNAQAALEDKRKELEGIVNPVLTKLESTFERRIVDDLEAGAWREDDRALRALASAQSALLVLQKASSPRSAC